MTANKKNIVIKEEFSSDKNKVNTSITNYAKRSEFIFLYDSRMANPNGDPDENIPRMDPYSGRNLVTEYRLKRTIRDYFLRHHDNEIGNKILIREELNQNNKRKTIGEVVGLIDRNKTSNQNNDKNKNKSNDMRIVTENIINDHIDVRLFGLMLLDDGIAVKKLGPIQFSIGISLNKVQPILIRNTRIVPTKGDAESGTFGEKTILKYSLILFHGFLNQIVAEKETKLTEDDVMKMMKAIWYGTNELSTSSKYGQMSRFLLRLVYKNENDYIGDLDKNLILENFNDQNIEYILEAQIDATKLFEVLEENKNIIEMIQYACHPKLEFKLENKEEKKVEKKNVKEYISIWSRNNNIPLFDILIKQEEKNNNINNKEKQNLQ